jgi:hypothetical protein
MKTAKEKIMNSPSMAMSMSSGTLEAALPYGDSEDEKISPYFQEMYM